MYRATKAKSEVLVARLSIGSGVLSNLFFDTSNHLRWGYLKCRCQTKQNADSGLIDAALDQTYKIPLNLGSEGELFLRQADCLSYVPKYLTKRNRWIHSCSQYIGSNPLLRRN